MLGLYQKSKKHLEDVNESYFKHFCFGVKMFACLLGTSFAMLIHALIPALFEFAGSGAVCALNEELQKKRASIKS